MFSNTHQHVKVGQLQCSQNVRSSLYHEKLRKAYNLISSYASNWALSTADEVSLQRSVITMDKNAR